ncbi:MAG: hypothetical protein VKJ24_21820 [Synechococcales bacterium]|nr:hypothetical protein [Synechococcales bacterium]
MMAALTLEILEPLHQANIVGTAAATVRLRGRSIAPPPVPLFYTWYTMPVATTAGDGALNAAADNPLDFTKPLAVGSYAITFSAKDRPGIALDQIKAVVHAGFAGGAEKPGIEKPCVIHVLQAGMLAPDPAAANVAIARNNVILKAKAPILWNDAEYKKINAIQYRWKWDPVGNPPNRLKLDQVISFPQLTFNVKDPNAANQPSVTYQANLQNQLSPGAYTLTLRVENAKNTTIGHEVSKAVTLS